MKKDTSGNLKRCRTGVLHPDRIVKVNFHPLTGLSLYLKADFEIVTLQTNKWRTVEASELIGSISLYSMDPLGRPRAFSSEHADYIVDPRANCHGSTFTGGRYWLDTFTKADFDALVSAGEDKKTAQRKLGAKAENLKKIICDDYVQLAESDGWSVAVFSADDGVIYHSIRKENGEILNKNENLPVRKIGDLRHPDLASYWKSCTEFYRECY